MSEIFVRMAKISTLVFQMRSSRSMRRFRLMSLSQPTRQQIEKRRPHSWKPVPRLKTKQSLTT